MTACDWPLPLLHIKSVEKFFRRVKYGKHVFVWYFSSQLICLLLSPWYTKLYLSDLRGVDSHVLLLSPWQCCRWVLFELDESKDIFLIWIRVHLFLLPSESLLCFPFHSALISSIIVPRHTQPYLPFVVAAVTGFSPPDNKLHFVECCSNGHPHPVPTRIYRQTCTCSDESRFFSSSFASGSVFICVFYFFIFIFCWQLNGTGRFHGLASLDDITAIISTPPLGGFQVATPTSPIWCSIQIQFSVMHRYVDDVTHLMGSCVCPLCLQHKIKLWLFYIAT